MYFSEQSANLTPRTQYVIEPQKYIIIALALMLESIHDDPLNTPLVPQIHPHLYRVTMGFLLARRSGSWKNRIKSRNERS